MHSATHNDNETVGSINLCNQQQQRNEMERQANNSKQNSWDFWVTYLKWIDCFWSGSLYLYIENRTARAVSTDKHSTFCLERDTDFCGLFRLMFNEYRLMNWTNYMPKPIKWTTTAVIRGRYCNIIFLALKRFKLKGWYSLSFKT